MCMQGDLAMLMLCPQDMLRAVELMSSADGPLAGWQISVGVHTGPALCGVVEGRQPKFALVGETVNIGKYPKVCVLVEESARSPLSGLNQAFSAGSIRAFTRQFVSVTILLS